MNKTVAINFDWKYSPNFKEDYIKNDFDDSNFDLVNIPHTNIELPFNNFSEKLYQFESSYRKEIWVDDFSDDTDLLIHFKAVMTYAKVYVNGEFVGEHKGGYTPFSIEISDWVVKNAYNNIFVYVDSNERLDIPPFGFVVDYLTFGGIYREVELQYRNKIRFNNINIKTKDVLNNPYLEIDLYPHTLAKSEDLKLNFKLFYQEDLIQEFSKNEVVSNNKLTVKEGVSNIKLWDIDKPHLYHLELAVYKNNELLDQHKIRFGFREAIFLNDGFYLNGNKIKIQGLNRHQSYPYVGYAMPKSAQYKDADILKKELGLNTVRLSHYPQSDHFLDRCDEIGLLVFDEIPGWQHIGDKAWQDLAVKHVEEMIMKDFNHPSVIIWGVRINESQDHDDLYTRTNEMAHILDDTRATGGVRCITDSNALEDVYTYNDFIHKGDNVGLSKKSKVTKSDKPLLITEYNGHMFPTKKYDSESHRLSHALRHMKVIDAMAKDDDIVGAIGWCMFDYNTHKDFGSGDRICYHGVMDMFRIPKYAAYTYGSQQSKEVVMQVASPLAIGEFAGSVLNDVFVFTNVDYVRLYKNGTFINDFYPKKDLYPHVKHPPILIDDFLGNMIEENEKFSKSDAAYIKKMLMKVNKSNGAINPIDLPRMGYIFMKYKMNMLDAEDLYTKYFGGWGGEATDYVFEGYIDDKLVKTVTKSQVFEPVLELKIDSEKLYNEDTYDTSRVVIRLLDEYGNDIYYANDSLVIEVEGPISVIGPKVISLVGGSVGFWIKSSNEEGLATIKVKSERFGDLEQAVEVVKR